MKTSLVVLDTPFRQAKSFNGHPGADALFMLSHASLQDMAVVRYTQPIAFRSLPCLTLRNRRNSHPLSQNLILPADQASTVHIRRLSGRALVAAWRGGERDPPVHRQHDAGDVAGFIGGKKDRGVADVPTGPLDA